MQSKMDDYQKRISKLLAWQIYLQAKWTSVLFETFKDIKEVWRIADHGTDEEKKRMDERLCDIFYADVAPAVFKLFGATIMANHSWDEFAAATFEVAGIDLDRDFLSSSPVILEIAPGVSEWVKR